MGVGGHVVVGGLDVVEQGGWLVWRCDVMSLMAVIVIIIFISKISFEIHSLLRG